MSHGDRLRALREAKGFKFEDLAEAAGVSTDYIRKIERGDRPGSVRVLKRLARALGLDLAALTSDAPIAAPPASAATAWQLGKHEDPTHRVDGAGVITAIEDRGEDVLDQVSYGGRFILELDGRFGGEQLRAGDRLLVVSGEDLQHDDLAVFVRDDGEGLLRYVECIVPGRYVLHPPRGVDGDAIMHDPGRWDLRGVATEMLRLRRSD